MLNGVGTNEKILAMASTKDHLVISRGQGLWLHEGGRLVTISGLSRADEDAIHRAIATGGRFA